jgi:hypothetical protein
MTPGDALQKMTANDELTFCTNYCRTPQSKKGFGVRIARNMMSALHPWLTDALQRVPASKLYLGKDSFLVLREVISFVIFV